MKSRIDKLEYRFEIDTNEDLFYYKNNVLHREKDLPAAILEDGSRGWFKNGRSHRDNGKPSHIYANGFIEWFENGNYIKDNKNEIKNK